MTDFITSLVKSLKDENTHVLSSGSNSAEFGGFIDTGSYAFNALLSGSIFGGMADNKVLALAGETSVGKTFFKLAIEKYFLESKPNSIVVDYDSESATTKDMYTSRGIDPAKVIISEPESIQKFRSHIVNLLDAYLASDKRPPMIISLDSLGNLSTEKEISDISEGKDTRDMTRAQLIRGAFRVIRLKLAKAKVPMIVTNHTYDVIGSYVPMKEMSGGGGLKYTADAIVFLSKKKDKDGTDVIGNIIRIKLTKSRLTKENSEVEVKLNYRTGLDRYYGLLPIALKHGIFTKLAKGIEINGKRVYEKELDAHPQKYYTQEVLQLIDQACKKEFSYGGSEDASDDVLEDEDELVENAAE
jgi:RecA/RadA recombinase